jgi:hypothetical protein
VVGELYRLRDSPPFRHGLADYPPRGRLRAAQGVLA